MYVVVVVIPLEVLDRWVIISLMHFVSVSSLKSLPLICSSNFVSFFLAKSSVCYDVAFGRITYNYEFVLIFLYRKLRCGI